MGKKCEKFVILVKIPRRERFVIGVIFVKVSNKTGKICWLLEELILSGY